MTTNTRAKRRHVNEKSLNFSNSPAIPKCKFKLTVRCGLDLGRLSHGLIRHKPTFRINQVRCENGVDERRLPQAGWSYTMQIVREN